MGRSVAYLRDAEFVFYFSTPDGLDDDGQYDDFIAQLNWEDLIAELKTAIKGKLPSYSNCQEYDGRETSIFLKNNLCNIGISEYCGLCSLSVNIRSNDYWDNSALASRHARQIRSVLEKIVKEVCGTRYLKQGTFSNGESFYQKV